MEFSQELHNSVLPKNLLYINVFLYMLGSFLGSKMKFCNLRVKETKELIRVSHNIP